MGLLKLKPSPAPSAHELLREHLRTIAKVQTERATVSQHQASARRDVDRVAEVDAELRRLSESIDERTATARYAGSAARDLSADVAKLNSLRLQSERLQAVGRAAAILLRKHADDMIASGARLDALRRETPRLLHAAAIENMVRLASEFRAKEEALRAIHKRVFAAAALADQLRMDPSNRLAEPFCGVALYADLHVSRPDHPSFQRGPCDPWQARLSRDEEARSVDVAAAELYQELLKAE